MQKITSFSLAVFAVFSLAAAVPAADLNTLSLADVREFSADIKAPAPQPVFQETVAHAGTRGPVIITVPGLKFGEIGWGSLELRNFLKLIQFFFRDKDISEADIVNGMVSFNPRYFFPESEEVTGETPTYDPARLDDNYLEQKLKEIPGYEALDAIVLPFAWSRDPGETKQTLPLLQARITEVYNAFKDSGRPIYILAHSWGSVLAHTALHRVAKDRPDVRVDKFITAGSPLVPANYVVKRFMQLEIRKEGLEEAVSKPAVVKSWRNFWAMRDAYSNHIPAADRNFQADAEVENVEPTLIDIILHKKPLRKEARKDLFKIRDIKAWHGAYFFDYKATLKSIAKEIFVPVFQPVIAPQVMTCSKKNSGPLCRP